MYNFNFNGVDVIKSDFLQSVNYQYRKFYTLFQDILDPHFALLLNIYKDLRVQMMFFKKYDQYFSFETLPLAYRVSIQG